MRYPLEEVIRHLIRIVNKPARLAAGTIAFSQASHVLARFMLILRLN